MSRTVSLRWQGRAIDVRASIADGRAALEWDERRVEAAVAREGRWIDVTLDGRRHRAAAARDGRGIWISIEGRLYRFEIAHRHAGGTDDGDASGEVLAPMTGRVAAVEAREGATVQEGDLLLTIEAMKMEFKVQAPIAGRVGQVACAAGDRVDLGQMLLRIQPATREDHERSRHDER